MCLVEHAANGSMLSGDGSHSLQHLEGGSNKVAHKAELQQEGRREKQAGEMNFNGCNKGCCSASLLKATGSPTLQWFGKMTPAAAGASVLQHRSRNRWCSLWAISGSRLLLGLATNPVYCRSEFHHQIIK